MRKTLPTFVILASLMGSAGAVLADALKDCEEAANSGWHTAIEEYCPEAAEAGHFDAELILGNLYRHGGGDVRIDPQKAFFWLRKYFYRQARLNGNSWSKDELDKRFYRAYPDLVPEALSAFAAEAQRNKLKGQQAAK